MAQGKTNAMRLLDKAGIAYIVHTYPHADGLIDGVSVAKKLGQQPHQVYKTLVTRGSKGGIYVFCIPVDGELDLKKAAKSVREKSVEMVAVSEIEKLTGYVRGGCSPLGMKKRYPVTFEQAVTALDNVVISGGRIGCQIELSAARLLWLLEARTEPLLLQDS